MKTINQFDVTDLDSILDLPLLQLDEEFSTFSPSSLNFSVDKRTFTLHKVDNKYILSHFGEEVRTNSKRLKTAEEMVKDLNCGSRWYRLATNEEVNYILMRRFNLMSDIHVYKKM